MYIGLTLFARMPPRSRTAVRIPHPFVQGNNNDVDAVKEDEGKSLLSSTSHCLASGLPMNRRETVMSLLASGFEPKTCIPLQENIHRLRHDTLSHYTKDLNIPVTSSILGVAIPGA
jgi:hypothetical protein